MNRRENKGFTLAELLIVVAIIAVLVAVAVSVFNRQLEESREAYDIATLRQAASIGMIYYYKGVTDKPSATKAGMLWWDNNNIDQNNASGIYIPGSEVFIPKGSKDKAVKPYGKGTKVDGGMKYTMGNNRGSYSSKEDYTDAVVLVSIYPTGDNPHIDAYWKNSNGDYIGGKNAANDPKYSIRINID
ncbi:MAG: prepilin-type N-terminal cleavage/methylation domain-containing protein [Clostridiales bacterium]|nr:prepilin-type N-terminal cleavage/methylation domain-containing protein [Clostridiales bacterium]